MSLMRSIVRPLYIQGRLTEEWLRSRVTYNPLSHDVQRDPYPTYRRLRERDPQHWSPLMQAHVFSTYNDVDAVLRDHKRFGNDTRRRVPPIPRPEDVPFITEPSMLFLDPPDHTRLRALVSKAFTPRAVAALEPRIREITHGLLNEADAGTEFDLIEALAYPLPVIVISEMLGVPAEDRAQFKVWSDLVARTLEPTLSEEELEPAFQAMASLDDYFRRLVAQRRDAPREDLISALIAAEEAGDSLTEDELLVMCRLLLVAGNETTTNLIGNGWHALLQHPQQVDLLRRQPELVPNAIEELLRYDSPVQLDGRTALEDVEFEHCVIAQGKPVMLLIGAANRDDAQFPDGDTLDVTREDAGNISFGRGIHHCVGAPLARLEGRVAFETLLERYADLQPGSAPAIYRPNVVLRGLEQLPVRVRRSEVKTPAVAG